VKTFSKLWVCKARHHKCCNGHPFGGGGSFCGHYKPHKKVESCISKHCKSSYKDCSCMLIPPIEMPVVEYPVGAGVYW